MIPIHGMNSINYGILIMFQSMKLILTHYENNNNNNSKQKNTFWVLWLAYMLMYKLKRTLATSDYWVVKPMSFHPFNYKRHIIAKPKSFYQLRFFNFLIILKFHVIIDLGLMCKVHAMST